MSRPEYRLGFGESVPGERNSFRTKNELGQMIREHGAPLKKRVVYELPTGEKVTLKLPHALVLEILRGNSDPISAVNIGKIYEEVSGVNIKRKVIKNYVDAVKKKLGENVYYKNNYKISTSYNEKGQVMYQFEKRNMRGAREL